MARTQVTGSEVASDSITGDDVSEETLIDSKIPFSAPEFVAVNLHSAVIEAYKTLYAVDYILVGYDNGDVLTSEDGYVLTEEL